MKTGEKITISFLQCFITEICSFFENYQGSKPEATRLSAARGNKIITRKEAAFWSRKSPKTAFEAKEKEIRSQRRAVIKMTSSCPFWTSERLGTHLKNTHCSWEDANGLLSGTWAQLKTNDAPLFQFSNPFCTPPPPNLPKTSHLVCHTTLLPSLKRFCHREPAPN